MHIVLSYLFQEQWTSLHLAAQNGHYSVVDSLIKYGAYVNVMDMVSVLYAYYPLTSVITQNHSTPLHLAAQNGHILLAENLIKCGAKVNATETVSYFTCMCTCNHANTVFIGSMDTITFSCTKWSYFIS